jgi:hypothetical protein
MIVLATISPAVVGFMRPTATRHDAHRVNGFIESSSND